MIVEKHRKRDSHRKRTMVRTTLRKAAQDNLKKAVVQPLQSSTAKDILRGHLASRQGLASHPGRRKRLWENPSTMGL